MALAMACAVVSSPGMALAGAPLSQMVGFEEPRYEVDALSTGFRVRVVIEPVPAAGLVSYGVTLKFDANAFDVGRPGIEVPAELNFNGFQGTGAFTDAGPGFASVKGTVDLMSQAMVSYDAPVLATFTLIPKGAVAGVTTDLLLEPFYTVGEEESLYVAGDGSVLDGDLVFGRTTLEFIPEPGPMALGILGGFLVARGARRNRRRAGVRLAGGAA